MKCLIQRVRQASVRVEGDLVGAIDRGLLVFAGVERGDDSTKVLRMADRLRGYRVFPDADGRMNCSVTDVGGGLLVISQFTLAADTRKGARPSFSSAAAPEDARRLFDELVAVLADTGCQVETGRFGADMQVSLVNDGPVTFLLET